MVPPLPGTDPMTPVRPPPPPFGGAGARTPPRSPIGVERVGQAGENIGSTGLHCCSAGLCMAPIVWNLACFVDALTFDPNPSRQGSPVACCFGCPTEILGGRRSARAVLPRVHRGCLTMPALVADEQTSILRSDEVHIRVPTMDAAHPSRENAAKTLP